MKKTILKRLTEKHNRCSLGLGLFKHELLQGQSKEEVEKALKTLKREGTIIEHIGSIGVLYKLSSKYKKTLK